jgi:DNA-binding LacI/PurR family transcriptional regulator
VIKKNLTLKEVAQALGVSTATVSNAFNRPDQLSAKLRERILVGAAEIGYTGPNFAARSLRRGESGVIAVMLTDSISYSLSDPVANQMLQGVAEILSEQGKQMLLLSSSDSDEKSSAESLPDGYIFYGAPSHKHFDRVRHLGKKIITVDFAAPDTCSVNIDNEKAAYSVASHLLAKGENQVAVLGMRLVDSQRICRLTTEDLKVDSWEISRQRLVGYQRAAAERNIEISPDKIWHIPVNTPASAAIAAREALTLNPRPNVLLCMSDVIALTAIRIARELGINVPQELRIVGFDDIPEASRSEPSLTTVCQQSIEKGRIATTMLLNKDNDKSVVLETQLKVRNSSAS